MRRRRDRTTVLRALCVSMLALGVVTVASGCTNGESAQRAREIATLRSQIEELRKAQEANSKDLARLAGEMKALDAQSAFVVGETKASAEDRTRVKAALEDTNKALQELRSTVEGLSKASPPSSPPAVVTPAPRSLAPNASPEQIYAVAMASLQAEAHDQAVLEFSVLTKTFPEDPLAASAQYWIGEAYYRQRDFSRALAEFRRVIDGYPKSSQVPEALLKIGLCHRALKDQGRAREAWQQVAKEYPGTNAASQARMLLATPGSTGSTQ